MPTKKCSDCKWICYVNGHYECHLHPPVLDGCHEPDKPCAWTFPIINPDNEQTCTDFK